MRDTPMVDAMMKFCFGTDEEFVRVKDAAKLERELNAANERIKRLEAVVNDPHALWANWLRGDVKLPAGIGDVRQYQAHIKRLEEAGDRMELYAAPHDSDKWNKAKEDKP